MAENLASMPNEIRVVEGLNIGTFSNSEGNIDILIAFEQADNPELMAAHITVSPEDATAIAEGLDRLVADLRSRR